MPGRHVMDPPQIHPFQDRTRPEPAHRSEDRAPVEVAAPSEFPFRPRAAVTHVNHDTVTPGLLPG